MYPQDSHASSHDQLGQRWVGPLVGASRVGRLGAPEPRVDIALYPLTIFRAANKAAESVLKIVRAAGTQRDILSVLQTRDELYEYLDYHSYESKLDELFDAETDVNSGVNSGDQSPN